MKKIIVAIIIGVIFYSLVDIFIWQRIFESNQMHYFSSVYYRGWHLVLISNVIIGSILLYNFVPFKNIIFYASTLYVFGSNGTEDILYFLLDGRTIPTRLEWLDNSTLILFKPVTDTYLIVNFIAWLIIWFFMWLFLWRSFPSYKNKIKFN